MLPNLYNKYLDCESDFAVIYLIFFIFFKKNFFCASVSLYANELTEYSNVDVLFRTKPVSFTDTDDPRHITLALTGDPTEMRVTWNSASPDNAVLIYGFEGTTHNFTLKPNTTTYSAEDLCGEPAKTQGWREPGYIHTVIITVIAAI